MSSCVISKRVVTEQAAIKKAEVARRNAVSALSAVLPLAALSEHTSAAAPAFPQPEMFAPGQAIPQDRPQAVTQAQGLPQLAEGSADLKPTTGSTAVKRPLPASGRNGTSWSDIVDFTDSPPAKRQSTHDDHDAYY